MKDSNAIEKYKDIVNRKTIYDELGDSFMQMGSQQARSGKQRFGNAVLTGFGSGLKAGADSRRSEKLKEVEEATRQVALLEAQLQTQAAMNTTHKLKLEGFVQKHKTELTLYNQAIEAGDANAQQKIMQVLFSGFKKDLPEVAEQLGEFSHTYDDYVFFKKNGDIVPIDRKSLFLQLPLEVLGDDARELENITSNYTNTKFERSDIDWSTKTLSEYAKIENTESDTKLKKSHSKYYDSQSNEVKPDPVAEHAHKEAINYNNKWLENNKELEKNAQIKNKVLDKMEAIIEKLDGKFFSGVGTGTLNDFKRYVAKQRNNKEGEQLSEADYLMKYFFSEIKGVAGNPNQKEWGDLMLRIINTGQNPKATLNMIEFEKERNNEDIVTFDEVSRHLSSINYRLPYHDPNVRDSVRDKIEARMEEFRKKIADKKAIKTLNKKAKRDGLQ